MQNRFLIKTAAALAWLLIWAMLAAAVDSQLLLPSPLHTFRALLSLCGSQTFFPSVAASLMRILLGFTIGLLLGGIIAIAMCASPFLQVFFRIPVSIISATPVASFILLALVWLRVGGVPVLATALVVLPLSTGNIAAGIRSTDANLLEMARAFGMPRLRQAQHLYWPSARPYVSAAITSGMGMAWKAGIAAEVLCTPRTSLGTMLYSAKIYLDMPRLFAATAVVIALSMALENIVTRIAASALGGHR